MNAFTRLRSIAFFLVLIALVASGVYWYSLAKSDDRLRADALAHATLRANQLIDLQAQHMEAMMLSIDLSLRHLRDAVQDQDESVIDKIAQTNLNGFPQGSVIAFSAFDREGNSTYSTQKVAKSFYVGDREYFKLHQSSGEDRLFINKPVRARATGAWAIPFTRPIFKQNRFVGVAVVTFDPNYIGDSLARLELGTGDIATLLYSDGTYMSRSRGQQEWLGKAVPADRPFLGLSAPEHGNYRALGGTDSVARLYAWRKLKGQPLIVAVGLDEHGVLAPVQAQIESNRSRSALGIVLLWSLIGVITGLMLRAAKQQKTLEKSEDRYRSLVDHSPMGILVHRQGRLIYTNPTAAAILSATTANELIGKPVMEIIHPDFQQIVQDRIKIIEEAGQAVPSREIKLLKLDGSTLDVQIQGTQVLFAGAPAIQTAILDITDRRRTEVAIAKSEAKYRTLVENLQVGVVLHAHDTAIVLANRMASKLLGLSLEQMQGRQAIDPAWHFVREDGSEMPVQEYPAAQVVATLEPLISFTAGIRQRVGADIVWVQVNAYPELDDRHMLQQIVVIFADITSRKQAEEKLQLAAKVFTHAREGITITDARGTIIDANEAFTRITGYSREEVLGKNPRILQSGRQAPDFYAAMWQDLTNKGHWDGEVWNRRKNGEFYAEMLTISAVRDASGVTQNYVALFTDITLMKEHQSQLEYVAHYDTLTGLPNRLLKTDRLRQAIAQCQRRNMSLAVAYLDLDNFKPINDTYSHSVGDTLLIELSKRMKDALREGDTLARIGGDEFVAIIVDLEQPADCYPVIERLLQAATAPITVPAPTDAEGNSGELLLQVSVSIGVTFYPQDGADADLLVRNADQAMYAAKRAGKNRYHLFDVAEDAAIQTRHQSREQIRIALANQEFVLHYQPKVNMRAGEVIGAEALIRWQHPEQGLLAPGTFLPTIENDPLNVTLGEWVITAALHQMAQWRALGLDIPVSVNVSARQFHETNFTARLSELLRANPDVPPNFLEIEVVETSALGDIGQVSELIRGCQALGVRFALDDFGTGYCSLTYLRRLPVEVLKIDQSFVRDMIVYPDDMAIVQGVVGLAAAFGREVIAEGVETAAHGKLLLTLGCELAQGFGIAKPMPASEIPGWVTNWRASANWTA